MTMRTNTDCTVFNQYHPTPKTTAWKATYLDAAFWEDTHAIRMGKADVAYSDSVRVFIPFAVGVGKSIVEPTSFSGQGWTLKPGDYLVKGKASWPGDNQPAKHFPHCISITEVATCDFGSSAMRHWEVMGK